MNGCFNGIISKNFATTRGIAIAKDKDKKKVRPVAIGLALRRIITAMITKKISVRVNEIAGDMNLGTIRNGIPILSELLKFTIAKKTHGMTSKSIIEFDIANAFNEISRRYMRKVCYRYCPDILCFFDSIYSEHSTICYGTNFQLQSTRGFQQGDGLAIMFSLCTYHIFKDNHTFKDIHFIKFFFF